MKDLKLFLLKNIKYKINKKKIGKNEITKLFKIVSEIIFIVVSENIIKNKPIKKAPIFIFV